MALLCDNLKYITKLSKLNVNCILLNNIDNDIRDGGIMELCINLSNISKLSELSIAGNEIRNLGICELYRNFSLLINLTSLRIDSNDIIYTENTSGSYIWTVIPLLVAGVGGIFVNFRMVFRCNFLYSIFIKLVKYR